MKNNCLIVLNFHSIYDPENKSKTEHFDPVYSITIYKFIEIIDHIIAKKIHFYDWKNNQDSVLDKTKMIAFTFDDGHESDYKYAFPKLKEHGIIACFFIVGNLLEKSEIQKQQIQIIHNQGQKIGSHSYTHQKLTKLSNSNIQEEYIRSKLTIEKIIGEDITMFAFPEGRYSKKIINIGKSIGFTTFCTTNRIPNIKANNEVIHRFNIKSNTTLKDLDKIINPTPFSNLKAYISSFLKYLYIKLID